MLLSFPGFCLLEYGKVVPLRRQVALRTTISFISSGKAEDVVCCATI